MIFSLAGCQKKETKRVTAYYSNWSLYDRDRPLKVSDLPYFLINDLVYAFMEVDEEGNLSLSDPFADVECHNGQQCPDNEPYHGSLRELNKLKEKAVAEGRDFKTFFSVGGWGKSDSFASVAADEAKRAHFAQEAKRFCDTYGFDGIDIDWEFPKNRKEGKHLVLLLQELNELFKKQSPPLLITVAAPGLPAHYKKVPWKKIALLVDRISVMTYDLHGPWLDKGNKVTNHQAALHPPSVGNPKLNIEQTMQFYQKHVPKNKLLVGIPLFFNTYANATSGLYSSHYASPYTGPGENKEAPHAKGTLSFRKVHEDVLKQKASGHWDFKAKAFSVYYNETQLFGSGMNDTALELITDAIKKQNYRGAMIWQLSGDTRQFSALKQIYNNLHATD